MGTDVFEKFLITLDFRERKMLLAPLPKNPNATSDDEWRRTVILRQRCRRSQSSTALATILLSRLWSMTRQLGILSLIPGPTSI